MSSVRGGRMSYGVASAPYWRFGSKIVVPMALATLGAIALALFGLFWATRQSDAASVERQIRTARHAIETSIDRLAQQQETVAIWDESAANLVKPAIDQVWVRDNVSLWLHNIFGHDEVFILAGDDEPIHALSEGELVPLTRYRQLQADLAPLVDSVRGPDKGPNGRHDRNPGQPLAARSTVLTTSRTTHDSHLMLIGGRPAAASAMLVQESTPGWAKNDGPWPVLISVRYLDGDFLAKLAVEHLIEAPRFSRTGERRAGEQETLIRTEAGEPMGYLIWRPELPGTRLMAVLGPTTLLAIAAMVALMTLLGRDLWRSTAELRHAMRQREQAERQALASAELLRHAQRGAGAGIWRLDFEAQEIVLSPESAAIHGLTGETRRSWSDYLRLIPYEDRAQVAVELGRAVQRQSEEAVYRIRHPDGGLRWVRGIGGASFDDAGQVAGFAGLMFDITDQKEAALKAAASEERLRQLEAELAQVSRIGSMSTLAASIAHEVNQPLAAVANYLSGARRLLRAAPSDIGAVAAALEKGASEAVRAGEIIQRLRRFIAKGESARQPEPIDVLIRESAALLKSSARTREARITLRLDPTIGQVLADRVQIQQVLFNLLRNAIEATDAPRAEVQVSTRVAGSMAEVRVADSGSGIAADVAGRLFEPFTTTKADGMGIGLSICRSIIRAHGGELRGWNRPEGGAVFAFTLPVAERLAA
jgi:PAS domain S-box-containing protein